MSDLYAATGAASPTHTGRLYGTGRRQGCGVGEACGRAGAWQWQGRCPLRPRLCILHAHTYYAFREIGSKLPLIGEIFQSSISKRIVAMDLMSA